MIKAVEGKIAPLGAKILVSHMEFGMEKTNTGILLHSDDGKGTGVHPRWAKVFAIGPEQTDVKVGEWVLLEHGRWSRGIKYRSETGEEFDIRLADNNAILAACEEKPSDVMRSVTVGAGSNVNFNIPGA